MRKAGRVGVQRHEARRQAGRRRGVDSYCLCLGNRHIWHNDVHPCREQPTRATHASATAASKAAMFSSAGGVPFFRLSSLVKTTVKGTCGGGEQG